MSGIFIIKGMALRVSSIFIAPDESAQSTITLQVAFDASVAWGRIALAHRRDALAAMQKRREAWTNSPGDEEQKSQALENEFSAAMQAIVAAAVCIDALYDHLLPFAPISREVRDIWSRKRTARYKQVCETIRAALNLNREKTRLFQEYLKPLFKLRDAAVHPSSKPHPPMPHPQLCISSDWRYGAFRGDVADMMVAQAIGTLWDATHLERYSTKELEKFMQSFRTRVEALVPDGRPQPLEETVTFWIPDNKSKAN